MFFSLVNMGEFLVVVLIFLNVLGLVLDELLGELLWLLDCSSSFLSLSEERDSPRSFSTSLTCKYCDGS